MPSGVRGVNVLLTAFLLAVMFPLTIYRFTASEPPAFLTDFPVGKGLFNAASKWLDAGFDNAYRAASGAFDGIRDRDPVHRRGVRGGPGRDARGPSS